MPTVSIKGSVGKGGTNKQPDVLAVQKLLNKHAKNAGFKKLGEDGLSGPKTIDAIKKFQVKVGGMKTGDGRVDPGKNTMKALNATPGSGGKTVGGGGVSTAGSGGSLDKNMVAYVNAVCEHYGIKVKIDSGKRSPSDQAAHMYKTWKSKLDLGWRIEYLASNRNVLNELHQLWQKGQGGDSASEQAFKKKVTEMADKLSPHVRGQALDLTPKNALNDKARKALGLYLYERKDCKDHVHLEVPQGKKVPKVTDAIKAKWPRK